MISNKDENETKLGTNFAYGLSFGLLGGGVLSLIGTMLENVYIQVGGFGIGLSLGVLIGALLYYIEKKK
ncbi:MAG: hypothetical protein ACK4M9_17160 [Anaerobacillus sp.]|jgi:hypothetical protein|uniref:hypothetical protein n=1 Tax=Anaerobacillus sp. TaxID=1872506 RepID=UPI00391C75BD